MNLISAVRWVPRGKFALDPQQAPPPTKEEIEKMMNEGYFDMPEITIDNEDEFIDKENLKDVENEQKDEEMQEEEMEVDEEVMKKYNMDKYDEEDGLEDLGARLILNTGVGMNDLYYKEGEKDPYMTGQDSDDDEEEDCRKLRPDDIEILAVHNEDSVTTLQIWVYEEKEDNAFIHHDLLLSNYGLCVEWLDFNPKITSQPGNFAAVGTFDPVIEIWDLDVLDPYEPICVLGKQPSKKKKKKKNKKDPHTHHGAILSLSWNKQFRNFIASASDDHTVKVWDINTQQCQTTLTHHSDKVHTVVWNPKESNVLLTGGYDKKCALLDPRQANKYSTFQIPSDIESAIWDPHRPQLFMVSLENGGVVCYDARNNKQPMFSFEAHKESCTDLDISPKIPGMLVTCSTDKAVKIWDVSGTPKLVKTNLSYLAPVFSAKFLDDLLAVGGEKNSLKIWKIDEKILKQ